jgi:hypothetical protein
MFLIEIVDLMMAMVQILKQIKGPSSITVWT